MSDKNLKKAAEEIKFIIDKYAIGGAVVLSTDKDVEFFYKIDPSWSIISHNTKTGEVRVKALLEDYPNKESQREDIGKSSNMIFGMRETLKTIHQHMTGIGKIFEDRFNIRFEMSELEPHVEPEQPKSIN